MYRSLLWPTLSSFVSWWSSRVRLLYLLRTCFVKELVKGITRYRRRRRRTLQTVLSRAKDVELRRQPLKEHEQPDRQTSSEANCYVLSSTDQQQLVKSLQMKRNTSWLASVRTAMAAVANSASWSSTYAADANGMEMRWGALFPFPQAKKEGPVINQRGVRPSDENLSTGTQGALAWPSSHSSGRGYKMVVLGGDVNTNIVCEKPRYQ